MSAPDLNAGALFTEFAESFRWSQRFTPTIKQVVGPLLLRDATLEEDTQESTDYLVLRADGLRIAARVRRPGYAERYGGDVTFTCRRESGASCEWDKMILGDWADWFFYGHAVSSDSIEVRPWFLIDLVLARPILRARPWPEKPNRDVRGKRCWFHPIPVAILRETIIAASGELPAAKQVKDTVIQSAREGKRCARCGRTGLELNYSSLARAIVCLTCHFESETEAAI